MTGMVGLIGVGAMGSALLERLKLADKAVKAFDIADSAMAAAREGGAETVGSSAEAATGVPCVHVFVRTGDEVLDATLGAGGVLKGAEPGTVVFLHSTINPATTQQVAEAAAKIDVTVLDAPVTAVPRKVRAGSTVFLLGGDEDAVAAHRHHLEPLGAEIIRFGPLGAGNVAKIAKNLINAAERVLLTEVMEIAASGGLDVARFMEMAVAEDGGSAISRWERAIAIVDNHPVAKPASNILDKDVVLAGELVDQFGLEAPITRGAAATAASWVAAWKAGQ